MGRLHPLGPWCGVHGDGREGLAWQARREDALHRAGESCNGKLRDELLHGELFTTLQEAQILIERWRREYNQIRPHRSLGYPPPAPAAVEIGPPISSVFTPNIELARA